MKKIDIEDYESFVNKFLAEYLADGMGAMPKREMDILIMSLLSKYGDLKNKGNQELSVLLMMTESKVKSLRYEALLKYPPDEEYVQEQFLIVLGRSKFELDKKGENDLDKAKIIFVIEDDFLRHTIQGRLKEKGMFADSSFNSEIIRIECSSLMAVIRELFNKEIADDFNKRYQQLASIKINERAKSFCAMMGNFAVDSAKAILSEVAVKFINSALGFT